MTLKKAKEFTETVVPWITILGLISAGGWTIRQYMENLKDTRVGRSLELLERFNRELGDSRLKIALAWESRQTDVRLLSDELAAAQAPPDQVVMRFEKFVLDLVEEEDLLPHITKVTFLLDEMVICAEATLCDGGTIKNFVGDFARNFFTSHTRLICKLRSGWKDETIALRLQRFFTTVPDNVCAPPTSP